jgi:hypothetical protein
MYRLVGVLSLLVCLGFLLGCGGITSKIVSKQEWSENYALMKGATATSPEMIDGNARTLGETTFPEAAQGILGASPSSEAIVTLPEKKVIRRIVINSANLKTFDVFADRGSGDWQLVKQIKSVKSNPIELSVPTSFPTDHIRIRVLTTDDDAEVRRKERARTGGRGFTESRRAVGKIYEVELYGYKSTEETSTQKTEDQREKELDELLK